LTTDSVEVREPRSATEWTAYYELRWRILRAPWQPQGPDRDASDDTSIHRLVCSEPGQVLAVGRLHRVDATTGQIRFMAVDTAQQRKGYGALLLKALEQAARGLGLSRVILQARENAVPFYRNQGYQVQEKTFLLFDEIQHYLMSKRLDGAGGWAEHRRSPT
jgi:N-acetylglutamate synthase-like GNAT family acetyltransferase